MWQPRVAQCRKTKVPPRHPVIHLLQRVVPPLHSAGLPTPPTCNTASPPRGAASPPRGAASPPRGAASSTDGAASSTDGAASPDDASDTSTTHCHWYTHPKHKLARSSLRCMAHPPREGKRRKNSGIYSCVLPRLIGLCGVYVHTCKWAAVAETVKHCPPEAVRSAACWQPRLRES